MRVDAGVNISEISHLTPGYVGADLSTLTREAAMSAINRILLRDGQQDERNHHKLTLDKIRSKLSDQSVYESKDLESVSITSDDFKVCVFVSKESMRVVFTTYHCSAWAGMHAGGIYFSHACCDFPCPGCFISSDPLS